jgi:putative nucleotidyltransferase with HDIG domain
MQIPETYKNRYVRHFTHIDNLPGILMHGLLSTNDKIRLEISHKTIAYSDIQDRRSAMVVPCSPGGVVHDYVPFYFCKRSSMLLAVVNKKIADQQLIIYLEYPINIINQYKAVFTDSAANTIINPNFYNNPEDLDKLNWVAIDSQKWSLANEELNRARMAELLVYNNIDLSLLSRIIVWNDSIADYVREKFTEAGIASPTILVDYHYYFVSFYNKDPQCIVTGPFFIYRKYTETKKDLLHKINNVSCPKFSTLGALRNGLQNNLNCIPETAELVGLESNNEMHSEDVGTHTLNVVSELKNLSEYTELNSTDKLLVEIAGYLHDIGKGPKSRWDDKGGLQQVDPDHSIKALPMVKRILSDDVGKMKKRSAEVICKLVCYHDLLGDIVGKGRRVEELEEIVETERELIMLIALGKADMKSVNPMWAIQNEQRISEIRSRVEKYLKSSTDDDSE